MDLPVFSNNLKSSANWVASLDEQAQTWLRSLDRSGDEMIAGIRACQVEQEIVRVGGEIDRDRIIEAAGLVTSWACDSEAKMSVEKLLALNRSVTGLSPEIELVRKSEAVPLNEAHDPTPAVLLPKMLDNAIDWFGAPGFGELLGVEQSTVVYLRLLEMHPFNLHTDTTALLASGFFTQRAGLPPLIVFSDDDTLARFNTAREAAFRMLTQPLVEFFAEMLTRTMQLSAHD